VLSLCAAAGCAPQKQAQGAAATAGSPSVAGEFADLSRGAAQLTAGLYPHLAASAGANTNLFVSPLSLSQGLGLAFLGARGETRGEMAQMLGWSGAAEPTALVRDYNRQLADTGDPDIAFTIANALWLAQGLPVRPTYLAQARTHFGAAPQLLDFALAPAASADRINGWIAEETKGRIGKIVSPDSLGPDTAALLTNALHFKGKWSDPFEDVVDRPFTRGDGSRVTMKMMRQAGSYRYRRTEEGQAVALPYGREGRFVMEIFLPRDAATLRRWERTMKSADFLGGEQGGDALFDLSGQAPRNVLLTLPRFEARFQNSVKPALAAAGMSGAFGSRADFSGIAENLPLKISDVVHATFLRVDEQGTEAAAATAVTIVVTGSRSTEKLPEMIVDRPFLAAIRDRKSGALLFFGRIAAPAPISG
jgi:serpin B